MDHRFDLPDEEPPGEALVPRKVHAELVEPEAPVVPEVLPTVDLTDPRTNTTLFFSRYQEDGTLRLYSLNSYIGEQPAGYSDPRVNVKIMVKRPSETFMVVIAISRAELDRPGAEERLAEIAYNWKNG